MIGNGVGDDGFKMELGEHLSTCHQCECVEPSNDEWNYCSNACEIIDHSRNERQMNILLAYVSDLHRQHAALPTGEQAGGD